MRWYWWIVKDSERTYIGYGASDCGKVMSAVAGPYWSREEAEKVLTLWT
jgi:hypothetical protein